VCAVHVPFDEEPLHLLDDPARPELAVIYQSFTLAWTIDGGRTIHHPPSEPTAAFNLHRFGDRGIQWVRIEDEFLYVGIGMSAHHQRTLWFESLQQGSTESPEVDRTVSEIWRIPLSGDWPAEAVATAAPAPVPGAEGEPLLRVVGRRLFTRDSPDRPFTAEVPLCDLVRSLVSVPVDFFGGTGARTL